MYMWPRICWKRKDLLSKGWINVDVQYFKEKYDDFIITDVDECASGLHNCQQVCVNTIGSFECGCKVGYSLRESLRECEGAWNKLATSLNVDFGPILWLDVDECRTFHNGHCDENAQCSNTDGSHLCICNDGFIGNGRTCISMYRVYDASCKDCS